MKVVKNKVQYTEQQIDIDAVELRQLICNHVKESKGIDCKPDDISFDIDIPTADGFQEAVVNGATVLVVKRGKVVPNGKGKKAETNGNGKTAVAVINKPVTKVEDNDGEDDFGQPKGKNNADPDDDESEEEAKEKDDAKKAGKKAGSKKAKKAKKYEEDEDDDA